MACIRYRVVVVAGLCLQLACSGYVSSGTPEGGDPPDAGEAADAAEAVDAGERPDAGEAVDAGERPDAGLGQDAGSVKDGGSCVPATCAQLGGRCGALPNGCGGTVNCGCAAPQSCGGGGTAGVCGCTKTTCAAQGKNCGTLPDNCGGTLDCGTCLAGQACGADVPGVCGAYTVPADPQYVIVHKSPTVGSPADTCCAWYWQTPASIDGRAVDEVREKIFGAGASSTRPDTAARKRRLGIGFSLSYLDASASQSDAVLNNLFQLAESKDFPIYIKLNGIDWWESRSDLWNWWDPNLPGFNPANVNNVEWTSWSSTDAVKLCWRNWGSQFRVRPHPNLGSPAYTAAKQTQLRRLIPIIARWYKKLPLNKRYLLAAVVLDNELSVGVNFYHYPNGNSYLTQPAANDPTYGLDFSAGTSGGLVQLGYAAAKSYGIASSGTLTIAHLDEVVRRHLEMLTTTARAAGLTEGVDLGNKLFTHGGGNFASNPSQTFAYADAVTSSALPGWSFYDMAYNPPSAPGLSTALDALGNSPWGASEWLYMGGLSGTARDQWGTALRHTLEYRNNRLVTIVNWDGGGIVKNRDALDGVLDTLTAQPACVVPAPVLLDPVQNGREVTLRWIPDASAAATYLNVSTVPTLRPGRTFLTVNTTNTAVTGLTSYKATFPPGTFYWNVIADGCGPTVQRAVSETRSFVVP